MNKTHITAELIQRNEMDSVSNSSSNSRVENLKKKHIATTVVSLSLSSPPSSIADELKPNIAEELALPKQHGINDTHRRLNRTLIPLREREHICSPVI